MKKNYYAKYAQQFEVAGRLESNFTGTHSVSVETAFIRKRSYTGDVFKKQILNITYLY